MSLRTLTLSSKMLSIFLVVVLSALTTPGCNKTLNVQERLVYLNEEQHHGTFNDDSADDALLQTMHSAQIWVPRVRRDARCIDQEVNERIQLLLQKGEDCLTHLDTEDHDKSL